MRVERNGDEVEAYLSNGNADLMYVIRFDMRDQEDAELLAELLEKSVIYVESARS